MSMKKPPGRMGGAGNGYARTPSSASPDSIRRIAVIATGPVAGARSGQKGGRRHFVTQPEGLAIPGVTAGRLADRSCGRSGQRA